MPQVRIANLANNFSAHHAMTAVRLHDDGVGIERGEIAGPAAAGIEFGIGCKQRGAATYAGINAVFMMIPITSAKSWFGRGMTCDFVFHRRQAGAPFLIAFDDFAFAHRISFLTV